MLNFDSGKFFDVRKGAVALAPQIHAAIGGDPGAGLAHRPGERA